MKPKHIPAVALAAAVALGACSGSEAADSPAPDTSPAPVTTEAPAALADNESAVDDAEQQFPDVIGAVATQNGATWTIAATLSSPYDSPERYADAFRILTPDGTVLGERLLTHDHADEQPFTRAHSGVMIPDDVSMLTIQGRDLEYGYGGETYQLAIVR